MTGVQIQYLLGIYFFVVSLSLSDSKITADLIKLIAGVILIITAFLGVSLIN